MYQLKEMTLSSYFGVSNETRTNHYINFNSHRHPRILIGVIKCLGVWPDRIAGRNLYQKQHHSHRTTVEDDRQKVLYVCDISERTQQVCQPFKSSNILRQSLVHVKSRIPPQKNRVVYDVQQKSHPGKQPTRPQSQLGSQCESNSPYYWKHRTPEATDIHIQ